MLGILGLGGLGQVRYCVGAGQMRGCLDLGIQLGWLLDLTDAAAYTTTRRDIDLQSQSPIRQSQTMSRILEIPQHLVTLLLNYRTSPAKAAVEDCSWRED